MTETFYTIFRQLNRIPRPSHNEEKVADFLCEFATKHGLNYRRDAQNCVVIEKAATPGYENAEPVVILNHMDMVCVAKEGYLRNGHPFNPLEDEIIPYIETAKNSDGTETRWMKAEGTSLGADNGMGLSMALAVLADDSLIHGPLEVLTTTNEEDGMSGAEGLSTDFIHGRKVLNLDSEAYNEITTGAAGACLQIGTWTCKRERLADSMLFYHLYIEGGLGGHSGVDINKGRCNCIKELSAFVLALIEKGYLICGMEGGTANASIASKAECIIACSATQTKELEDMTVAFNASLKQQYQAGDSAISVRMNQSTPQSAYIANAESIFRAIQAIPFGVQAMREDMPDTVMTSNNIGVLHTINDTITLSCHTRSFDDTIQTQLSDHIREIMLNNGAEKVDRLMNTPAWMEKADSPLLALTCQTFKDVLGFEPKKVAMHFVLEAAYYVQKYPGVEIASIGPLIIEPHSTSERVSLDTADNIWLVVKELLKRLAQNK